MPEPRVWVFFYGSFINNDVLARVDLIPGEIEVARLPGFDIRIEPLANLIRSESHSVYGTVATVTHAELDRLYRYADETLGGRYLPEAVLVETQKKVWRPALCYIAPHLTGEPATNDYVDRIVGPAEEYGFPDSYIARLESFRP